jgi:hypothetical protein
MMPPRSAIDPWKTIVGVFPCCSDNCELCSSINLIHLTDQGMFLLWVLLIDAVSINPKILYTHTSANRQGILDGLW